MEKFVSLIQVEKSFQILLLVLKGTSSQQYKLAAIAEFYRATLSILNPIQLGFYFREIIVEINELVSRDHLAGLSPEIIQDIDDVLDELLASLRQNEGRDLLVDAKRELVKYQLELNLYLGDWAVVFKLLSLDAPASWDFEQPYSHQTILELKGLMNLDNPLQDILDILSASQIEKLNRTTLGSILIPVVDYGSIHFDSHLIQGILLKLQVRATLSKGSDGPYVFFNQILLRENQSIIQRIQQLYAQMNVKNAAKIPYNLHIDLGRVGQTFSGYSYELGLALGLERADAKYYGDWNPNHSRQSGVLSGVVGETGEVLAVDNRSLEAKIQAAFFSEYESLTLPRANHKQAELILADLKNLYPNKPFSLVLVNNLDSIVTCKQIRGNSSFPYTHVRESGDVRRRQEVGPRSGISAATIMSN